MSTNRLARTSFLTVLAGLVGAMALLAGPAGAQTSGTSTPSGGALAVNGSVASGTAQAYDESTASGSAVARGGSGGSVASGCATAIKESTASGGDCPPPAIAPTPPSSRAVGLASVRATTAAATAAGELAVTGSSADTMVTMAGAMLVLGALLVVASRRRSTTN